jgi:MFS family permease
MDDQQDMKKTLLPPKAPHWVRVLPGFILIIIITTIDGLLLNDFVEYRYTNIYRINMTSSQTSRELCLNLSHTPHPSDNMSSSTTVSPSPISTTESSSDMIQKSTASLNVIVSLAATIPSILTSILLGANCDRIGRKPVLILPFIGKIIRYAILTVTCLYNLSDRWIIISTIMDGVFGTSALSILGTFAYVSDCTDEKTRTKATVIVDVCITCSRFIPLLALGIYLQNPYYIQTLIFTLVLSIFGFLFCIFLQPESKLDVQHMNFIEQFKQINIKVTKNIFHVFIRSREQHKQRSLLLLVSIHLSIIVMICGYTAISYLYLYGAPFCMDSLGVSLNSAAQTLSITLMTIPFTLTVGKHSDHLFLPIIGCIAYIAQLTLFGIAQDIWLLYVAVCVGGIFTVLSPIIRARITKLVEPGEYAAVFILASIFESGGYYAISALTNAIYSATIQYFHGLVFFVLASFGILAIILIL